MAAKTESPSVRENPYLAGRREWNERYGEYISREKAWKQVALLTSLIALVAVGGISWIGAQSKLVPFLVTVNDKGDATVGHLATEGVVDDNLLRALMAGWVEDWRTVSVDAGSQGRQIDHVYAHLAGGDPAFNSVNTFYRANNPYERAAKETVTVTIKSVLRTSAEALEVEWVEEVKNRKGFVQSTARYKAVATTSLSPPTREEDIMRNPTGFFIKDLNWAEQIASP